MTSPVLRHRQLSVLVGILVGILLSLFATSNPLSDFGLIDLIIFVSIPALSGALSGFSDPENAVNSGALVGFIVGLAYVTMTGLRLPSVVAANMVLFLVLTVPIWGFLAAAGGMFAHRAELASRRERPSTRVCSSCKSANPPDALFCKNCGTKLG